MRALFVLEAAARPRPFRSPRRAGVKVEIHAKSTPDQDKDQRESLHTSAWLATYARPMDWKTPT